MYCLSHKCLMLGHRAWGWVGWALWKAYPVVTLPILAYALLAYALLVSCHCNKMLQLISPRLVTFSHAAGLLHLVPCVRYLSSSCRSCNAAGPTAAPTASDLLHFCVVGSGPAGFYTVDRLLKRFGNQARVDLLDRLPTPFGLVRSGVAPDHQDTKNVINQFTAVGQDERVQFFGNVRLGQDVSLAELRRMYHGVVLATGAESDKQLGIPGEAGLGVFCAREFVWWYNGHPDACKLPVDLKGVRSVAICGIGNVALDCARILVRDAKQPPLSDSDIAAHALTAIQLAQPQLRDVHLVARRGPVQAACTPKELKELVSEPGVFVHAPANQMVVSAEDQAHMKATRMKKRVYDLISQAASSCAQNSESSSYQHHLHFQFYRQPRQVIRDRQGKVVGLQVEVTALQPSAQHAGSMVAVGTGQLEVIPAQLILVSIGYKSVPLVGAPFDERRGVIPNVAGRVLLAATDTTKHKEPTEGAAAATSAAAATGALRDADAGKVWTDPGLYVCGWLKRGPSGIIGTNAVDAEETVSSIVQDVKAGLLGLIDQAGNHTLQRSDQLRALLQSRGVHVVGFDGWKSIDAAELRAGGAVGKIREKFLHIPDMLKTAGVSIS